MRSKYYQKGISIVETVIAIAILALIGAALVNLTGQITSLNNSAVLKSRATGYAEQAIEQVRAFRSSNPSTFAGLAAKGTVGGFCYGDVVGWTSAINACNLNCPPMPGSPISGTNFNRWVRLTTSGSSVKVESRIVWLEKANCRNVQLDEYIYDY